MKFSILPRRYAYFSAITFCAILALHFTFLYDDLFQGSKIAKFFSLRHELNLPTFVSSLNLYLASLLSLACGLTQKNRRASRFFGFVAFILLVMGYDEAAGSMSTWALDILIYCLRSRLTGVDCWIYIFLSPLYWDYYLLSSSKYWSVI